ncbi:hypothetical protein PFICI_11815 [Pestalotiopsis fici W106-1]|uniref:Uncharacterized protein n=1 Tax=Pestalotiopsis fici (strain W106-1 / CGMCC3.15140) TaxID=1229662 RepID=W3WRF3_PESFW|nr:uncharacterized protein PFICI_11815 [Pestalotiopsis fici W106-1]ETS76428.1 hypothetical protein PFICI_11815 [Pestalotiopsis fici W106-1]
MESSSPQAMCYRQAALAVLKGDLSTRDALQACLAHLGHDGALHLDDNELGDRILGELFWKGDFGPVAACIKLCESAPLPDIVHGKVHFLDDQATANQSQVDQLLSIFLAATSESARLEDLQSLPGSEIMGSALFRQALIITAISINNLNLAKELTYDATLPLPPDEQQCVFKMHISPFSTRHRVPECLLVPLINAGWLQASPEYLGQAACSEDAAYGIALFEALQNGGVDLYSNPIYGEALLRAAVTTSQPELVEYLRARFPLPLTDDMVIQAVEARNAGGVEMLRYLLDHNLDVNHLRSDDILGSDPRDRAERDYAAGTGPMPISETKTALHAAAAKGNHEAMAYLLERGADKKLKDGLGHTAQDIAEARGLVEALELLKRD